MSHPNLSFDLREIARETSLPIDPNVHLVLKCGRAESLHEILREEQAYQIFVPSMKSLFLALGFPDADTNSHSLFFSRVVHKQAFQLAYKEESILLDPKLYEAAMNGDLIYLQTVQETLNLPSQLTPNRETVLHIATEFRRTEFVRMVMRDCPSLIWQANSFGDTALHIAAREDLVDVVEFFIDCALRADVETGQSRLQRELLRMVNLDADAALHCAARKGSYSSVELLVEADPEVCKFVNNANESPLYLYVASGFFDVPRLITKEAAPNLASCKGANGLTALHPTLFFSNYALNTIELLVKWRREMIREGDSLGLTPLHYAALYGRTEAIKLFLEYDSSAIYLLDAHGESALHVAAFRGHIKALEELTNCRPDSCNLIDNKGRTALHAAVLGDRREVVEFILGSPRLARLTNKPDKDGNTPLHLAALFKLYAVIEILAKNKDVSLTIVNKEFLTPLDVYNKHKEEGLRAAVARSILKGFKGIMTMQRFADAQLKKMNKEGPVITTPNSSETTTNNVNKENSDFEQQSALEVNLLVATLVATVTFAAGFTMPGGYVNNGPDEGLATLTIKAAFEVFVVFNTLAFCCSVFAVLLQFHTSLADYDLRVRYMGIAAISTTSAILAMVIAFSSGTYVVLTKSTGLSITPYVICGCFVFLYFAIPLADPGVEGFPCLSRLQKFARDIVIRYVRCE